MRNFYCSRKSILIIVNSSQNTIGNSSCKVCILKINYFCTFKQTTLQGGGICWFNNNVYFCDKKTKNISPKGASKVAFLLTQMVFSKNQ